MTAYTPDRGDAIWLTLDPRVGHEQSGRRPAVVLSPSSYNGRVGLCVCCPITSQMKGYPFEVTIPSNLPVAGVVLSDQVKNIDWRARNATYICALPPATLTEIRRKLLPLL